jgi:hypothetical protein
MKRPYSSTVHCLHTSITTMPHRELLKGLACARSSEALAFCSTIRLRRFENATRVSGVRRSMNTERFTSILLALSFLLTSGCNSTHIARDEIKSPVKVDRIENPTLTLAEQEVIESLLSQEIETKTCKKHTIAETSSVGVLFPGDTYESFSEALRKDDEVRDPAFREALEDFLKKNVAPVRIVFPTDAPKSVELVSDAAQAEIFLGTDHTNPNGWDLFYHRFPDSMGLFTISRVGIDSGRTVAIVYLGRQSHYLSGRGRIRILRREGGRWVLQGQSIGPRWVS